MKKLQGVIVAAIVLEVLGGAFTPISSKIFLIAFFITICLYCLAVWVGMVMDFAKMKPQRRLEAFVGILVAGSIVVAASTTTAFLIIPALE